jgi:ABC-type branched-subunit amino acid transport system substrate-binding protein
MAIAAEATYERNTVAVKTGVLALKQAAPEAVVIVGAYKPVAEFIKLSKKVGFNPVFVNISFVGANALAKELGPEGKGVIVSQVVPFPADASLPVVADYHKAIKAAGGEPEFVSLEGYLAGRLAIAALDKAGKDVTREGMLKAIKETGKFDIGGLPMTFSAEKNEGLDKVWMTIIEADGSFKPIEKMVKISAN